VVIIGCTDMLNRCLSTEELDQERNLFYVACTRAKDTLLITSPSRCITRLLFPADRSRYELVTDDESCSTPIFGTFGDNDGQLPPNRFVTNFVRHASGEFYDRSKQSGVIPQLYPGATFERLHAVHGFPASGDTNILHGSAVERVIYRQVMSACVRSRGLMDHQVRMTDHFPDKCFLWVKAFEDNRTLPEPTAWQVESRVHNLASEFEVDPRKIVMHFDGRHLPAFAKNSKDSLLRSKRFDDTMRRIRENYKDYIRFDHDTESREAFRKITDVAVCAHLVYPPARTYFAFTDLHLGDLSKDKNLGLFGCTKRFVESILKKHLECFDKVDMLPAVITPDDMFEAFGVTTDKDLSTESLRGVADLIVGDCILDIKCSAEKSGIQAQWVLQLLTYAGLARLKGIFINKISIYNPIQGYVWTAPIDDWQRHEELLRDINDEISEKRNF
jgi:hypothetical protein